LSNIAALFNKLSNGLATAIKALGILAISIILLPFVTLFFILISPSLISSFIENKRFKEEYKLYLQKANGTCFFCYNNRKSSVAFARDIIVPALGSSIQIVFVEGREIKNCPDSKFISEMLYSIQERKGFPYLLKIEDEQVLDYSVNNQFYSTMIGSKPIEALLASINAFYTSYTPSSN
jgi:hypothetical protein